MSMPYRSSITSAAGLIALLGVVSAGALTAQRPVESTAQVARRIQLLGGSDVADDRAALTRLEDLAVSPTGRIYALDNGESNVKMFDGSGRFLGTFGRKGEGPGEMSNASAISWVGGNLSIVAGSNRYALFDPDGKHVRTRVVASDSLRSPAYGLAGGRVLRLIPVARPTTLRTPLANLNDHLVLSSAGSRKVDTIARISSRGYFELRNGMIGGRSTRFGASGAWAVHGDSLVAIVDGLSATVSWYAAGPGGLKQVRHESLGRQGQAVSNSDIALEVDAYRRSAVSIGAGGVRTATSPPTFRFVNPPARWSVATEAIFAADGSLFVRMANPSPELRIWRVFPVGGGEAFEVAVPSQFILRAIRGSRLYGIDYTDRDGVKAVGVYEYRTPS